MNADIGGMKRARILHQIEELTAALEDQTVESLRGSPDKAWAMRTTAEIEKLQSRLRALSESIAR